MSGDAGDGLPAPPGGTPEVDDGRVAAPEAQDPLLGSALHGRYRVLRELGWGSLGRVYLVRDLLRGGEELALKAVRADRVSETTKTYLRREFRFLAGLRHPNVVRVYDLDRVPGSEALFFTLEHLPGRTVVAAARERPWRATLELLVQTLRALAFVHDRGLIHMDLKPPNVLVLEDEDPPRACLLDFHLALGNDEASGGTMRGTIAYMAPEVIRGAAVDARTDLYSFGAVAYEALVGVPPFHGRGSAMDVLRAHAREPAPAFAERGAELPAPLEAVILRLLSKDPAERFPSAQEVIRALNHAAGERFLVGTEATRRSYLQTACFVGREEAQEQVLEAARRVLGDEPEAAPRAFRIAGEEGIGKTRLLGELKTALQLEGLPCLLRQPGGADAAAFEPVLDAAGELLRRAGATELLAELAPSGRVDAARVEARLGAELTPGESAEGVEPMRRGEAVSELLRQVAAQGPFALAIDDVDQADAETRALVRALLLDPPPGALLLLVGSDPLGEGAAAADLELNRLTRAATGRLLAGMLGARVLPETLVAKVWELTGGNPHFVEETMRSLADTGALQGRDGGLSLTPDAASQVLPQVTLGELTAQRVARLDDVSLRLLGALALGARPRPLPFAAQVAGLRRGVAEEAFRGLERRGFVTLLGRGAPWGGPGSGGRLGPPIHLEHEPLREATLDAIGEEELRGLHERAVRLLESRHPAAGEDLGPRRGGPAPDRAEELLWHSERMGRSARALRYAVDAADAARARREFLRARGLYERALELFDRASRELGGAPAGVSHLELTLRLCQALAATGARGRALQLLAPLAEPIPRHAAGLRLRARLRKDRGDLRGGLADVERARACAEEARERGEEDAERELARCRAEEACIRLWMADYPAARRAGEAALEILGDPALPEDRAELGALLDTLHHACHYQGEDARALEYLRQGLQLREQDPVQRAESGRFAAAALEAEPVPVLGDGAGARVPRSLVEVAYERTDRARELVAHCRRRVQLLEAAGDRDGAAYAALNLAHLRRARGRVADAQAGYQQALALFLQADAPVGAALVHLSRARMLAELGDAGNARREAQRAEGLAQQVGSRWMEAQARLARAEAALAAALQDPAVPGAAVLAPAREALDEAAALASELGNRPQQAEQALFRAELARLAGDAAGLRAALDAFAALPAGSRSVTLRARADLLGALLVLEGDPDPADLEEAEARAASAFEESELRGLSELGWRAAWVRARVRRAAGDAEGELHDLIAALEILRETTQAMPKELRPAYLTHPERVALRERFGQVRAG